LLDELSARALLCETGESFLKAVSNSLAGLFPQSALLLENGPGRTVILNQTLRDTVSLGTQTLSAEPEGSLRDESGALHFRRYHPSTSPAGYSLVLLHELRLPHRGGPGDLFFMKLAELILFNSSLSAAPPELRPETVYQGQELTIIGRSPGLRQICAHDAEDRPQGQFHPVYG
jgi:hypothetical protein